LKNTTLGIDLGTNSIGWALLRSDGKNPDGIIDCGVRIFQEAVESKTRTPKNLARRDARAARRLVARRRIRKESLRALLVQNGLLPETEQQQKDTFSLIDPYELRATALDEKLTLQQFGRAIYHLNQRRGFLSNRKAKDAKEDGKVKSSISELKKSITNSGSRTLGEYLFCQNKRRNIYTDREMYVNEFNSVWESQQRFYPGTLTDELKKKIFLVIFFQRPLRIQKFLVGTCTFLKGRRKAARGTLQAQRFRIWQDINNLQTIDPETGELSKLNDGQRDKLFNILENQKSITWSQVRKKLGLHEGEKFNLETETRSKIAGNITACDIRKIVGDPLWHVMSDDQKDQLVEDLLTIHDDAGFTRRMKEFWKFDDNTADKLTQLELPPGYANLSMRAIRRILPFLEQGHRYDEACKLAGFDHSQPGKGEDVLDELPAPDDLRNPVVMKALHETRKLVNAIIRKYGKPDTVRIEMAREMKMNQRQKANFIKNQSKLQKDNERINDLLRKEFGFQNPSRDERIKYSLWEECDFTCPYTGKSISSNMLFSPEVDIEHILPYSKSLDDSYLNKTLCLARENRDVKKNKSPYEAYHYQEEKYNDMLVRVAKSKMSYRKKQKFHQQETDIDGFISRQLNDTRYISKEVKNYMLKLGIKVDVTAGGATAVLRRKWGMNNILPAPKTKVERGVDIKVRTDHRHHTVDVIVIALTSRSLFQKLSRLSAISDYGYGLAEHGLEVDSPWADFRSDVRSSIEGIIVSHAPLRKIRGALHEQTAYGFVGDSLTGGKVTLVYRVPLSKPITAPQVKKNQG
jgi:CRISPR-associated endonuclease Csn1